MPGLVGLITRMPRECAEQQLLQMLQTLCHESFYTSGTWIDAAHGIYVGWVARRDRLPTECRCRTKAARLRWFFQAKNFLNQAPPPHSRRGGMRCRGWIILLSASL